MHFANRFASRAPNAALLWATSGRVIATPRSSLSDFLNVAMSGSFTPAMGTPVLRCVRRPSGSVKHAIQYGERGSCRKEAIVLQHLLQRFRVSSMSKESIFQRNSQILRGD